jgi:hypothetical protein
MPVMPTCRRSVNQRGTRYRYAVAIPEWSRYGSAHPNPVQPVRHRETHERCMTPANRPRQRRLLPDVNEGFRRGEPMH